MNTYVYIPILVLVGIVPTAFAIEEGTYFVDDFESIALTIEVEDGEISMIDGFIQVKGDDFELSQDNIWRERYYDSGDEGRIIGQTTDGHWYYIIYKVDDNGKDVDFLMRTWVEGNRDTVKTQGEVDRIF